MNLHTHVYMLMRDEGRKEERSKQGYTNKAKQHSTLKAVTFPKNVYSNNMYPTLSGATCSYMFLMRDEKEERKKQARSNKQTRQSNTDHPR